MTQISTTPDNQEQNPLSRPLLATITLDWEKAIYIAFILFAILTRFWDLGSRVMSHDESLHTQFSYQFYRGDGYTHTPLMHGPFLFHATALSYWLFGDSDLSARIPVAILGVILVAMPCLFRRWLGRVGALFTSFILLISPYITYYSRYIRHDIYVIVWALIVFASIWFYLRYGKEKHLWWFAAGTALMFSTKEVAFIYVAIFGSFLAVRLLAHIGVSSWFSGVLPKLKNAIGMIALGVLMIGAGFISSQVTDLAPTAGGTGEATEGFAADPSQDVALADEAAPVEDGALMRWVQIAGVGVFSLGLFMAANKMRPQLDQHREFDLIVMFTTLVLPTVSPFLVKMAGWNPRDYTMSSCVLQGQESMTSLQTMLGKLGNSVCWTSFFSSGIVRSAAFLILTLVIAILIGLWWGKQKWLVPAVIFHSIFLFLYTSVFTNPGGWHSGMVGSLGYWLEQQAVQRGSQPTFYYLFVTPFYEFLPLLFSILAVGIWTRKQRINKIASYWLTLLLTSWLVYGLVNWLFNRPAVETGSETTSLPGAIAGLLLAGIGFLYFMLLRRRQLQEKMELQKGLLSLFDPVQMTGFVPSLIWWLVLTAVLYSYAGEKMPWLSTHFVIPMAFLVGIYFQDLLGGRDVRQMFSAVNWQFFGLTILLILAVALALGPMLLGEIQFGQQSIENLTGIGRFLGGLLLAGGIYYLWQLVRARTEESWRKPAVMLALFALLSLLTIRFTYLANFPNADYTTEFMVYAHGAPATKHVVMDQVEELSNRLYGDKSIRVAFSGDTSWPFTWYLREYPNRVFFGTNPDHSLKESPVVLVGSLDWATVEPYLGSDYESHTYTYLWWPMEEYRKISWNAIFGDRIREQKRGLGDPAVRQALWDIFFYRDFEKFGSVFGGSYTPSSWPLRHEMRLYIRKDVLSSLWDRGIGPVNAAGLQDPYEANDMKLLPVMALNENGLGGSGDGQLLAPRNVSVGADGRIYVADSGNHRVQVFAADGTFVDSWGAAGTGPGNFNEPWSLLATDRNVYVADTWNHRVEKFDLDGQLIGTFGRSGSPADTGDEGLGQFFGPRDIIALADGRFLVTDTGNHRLQVMDQNGSFLNQVGSFGNLLGQVNEPVGLAAAPDGSFYLADTWNGRIQHFSAELYPINEWQVDAWKGQSTNNKPYMAVDSAGRVYVTDPEGYRVLIFSDVGDYLGRFGSFGTDLGSFGLPNGIAIDAFDNVYIADAANNRILKFAPVFAPAPASEAPPADELPAEEQPVEDSPAGQSSPPASDSLDQGN